MEILDGDSWLALAAVVATAVSLGTELLLLRWQVSWFYTLGFPLARELVPLASLPEGAGRTRTLDWEVDPEARQVRFRARQPRGLHGVVHLVPRLGGGCDLDVRWAPPWTPMLATVWLAVVGVARGDALLTGPLAAMLAGGLLYAYWIAAVGLSRELRYSLDCAGSDQVGSSPGAQGGRPS